MTLKKILPLCLIVLLSSGCSKIAAVAASLTGADCDDLVLEELSADFSDDCQGVADYLDAESDSLQNLAQNLPTANFAATGESFMQITDAEGSPIEGITAEDVAVSVSTDGGQTFTEIEGETVAKLSEVETTQTAILANVDYSASISDTDLNDVVSGTNVFLNALTVGYNGAVVKFSTNVDLVQDFTETAADLIAASSDTGYSRELTSLYDAVYDGVTYLSEQAQPLKLMILFTDGMDNDSTHTLAEAIAHAQENKIPVCVVGVTFADTSVLEQIASDTGCFYIYKQFFASLDDAFANFAEQINNFYTVTLPDTFDTTSGILKTEVDAGAEGVKEFTSEF